MTLDELSCKIACQDTLVRLCEALDRGDGDAAADCFTANAVLELPAGNRSGPDVRATLKARPSSIVTRHVMSNLIVEPDGLDAANARAYILVYRVPVEAGAAGPLVLPTTPQAAGDWTIGLAKTADGWRVARYAASEVMVPAT